MWYYDDGHTCEKSKKDIKYCSFPVIILCVNVKSSLLLLFWPKWSWYLILIWCCVAVQCILVVFYQIIAMLRPRYSWPVVSKWSPGTTRGLWGGSRWSQQKGENCIFTIIIFSFSHGFHTLSVIEHLRKSKIPFLKQNLMGVHGLVCVSSPLSQKPY